MPTNVRTDNRDLVTQHAGGTVVQPVDPVLLKPKGDPGVATHTNDSRTLHNAGATVFDHGTRVAHRQSILGAGRHTPDVIQGQNVPVRDGDNSLLSWAKDVFVETANAVMHDVETGVNILWELLPPEVKNVLQNGEAVVSGLTPDHFVDAAKEEGQAMLDALMSKDTLFALAQTAVLMGLTAIPVVGQIAGGVATALRIKAAVETVAGAAEELKAILEQWTKPMSPAQLEAARKRLASWLLRVGIAVLLAALGKAIGKIRTKVKSRNNSRERVDVGTGPAARVTDCPCAVGSPVIIAVGEKTLAVTDFSLPGDIDIEWTRSYRSGDVRDGWFGQGWSHRLAVELILGAEGHTYRDPAGRHVALPAVPVGAEHRDAYEQLTFCRPAEGVWQVNKGGLTHVFERTREDLWRLPLSALLDQNGNRVLLAYPPPPDEPLAAARPLSVTDSRGRLLELTWDDRAHLTSVTVSPPAGRSGLPGPAGARSVQVARYAYSPEGDLATVTDAAGTRRTYSFRNHVLVGYTRGDGGRFHAEYDMCCPTGRVKRSWNEETGEGLSFEYDDVRRLTHVTDSLGRRTTFEYDERRDIVATTGPDGRRTETPFNANGHPRGSKDPLGRETHLQFDARGNLTTVIDASGARTKIDYDHRDLPITLTDAAGSVWRREYDARGNLATATDPLGHATRYLHDERGRVVEVTDALGRVRKTEWDEMGNPFCVRSEAGGQTTFEHDALGRVVRQVDALGFVATSAYDDVGNLIEHRDPDGAVHHYRWDGEGQLLAYTDPLGRRTSYRRDALGRVVERTDAAGRALRYEYDLAGRLASLVNQNGAAARFSYDPSDNLVEEVGFDGRVVRYSHDAADELTELVEVATGVVARFVRDPLGRLLEKRFEGDDTSRSSYSYDALGRLLTADNPAARVAFTYDALGRLLSETQALRDMDPRTLGHRYDALGNRVATTLPDGRALSFERSASGRLRRLALGEGPDAAVVDIERDALDREVRRMQGALESRYEHDSMGRLARHRTSPRAALARAPVAAIERAYRYDLGGDLVERFDSLRGAMQYVYDDTSRILSARSARTGEAEVFRFDPAGNLIDVAGEALGDNRLRSFGGLRYVHDAPGNVVERARNEDDRTQLAWSANGMLANAVVRRGGVTQTTTYEYDALGRRTRKSDVFGATVYLWDGNRMIESRRGRRLALYLFEPETFVPIATVQNDETYWYHCDHLGTPQEVTDVFGRIVWAADYKVWGEATLRMTGTGGSADVALAGQGASAKVSSPIEQPFRFLGQQLDEETGLCYNRFRYYDPATGRFLTQDPLGLEGGEHPFVYAPNPTGWVDPFGLAKKKRRPKNRGKSDADEPGGDKPGGGCDCTKWALPKMDRLCHGHVPGVGHAKYARDASTGAWYSQDKTGHGGSFWKKFAEVNGGLVWEADLDEAGKVLPKHKGPTGTQVDLDKLKCKDV